MTGPVRVGEKLGPYELLAPIGAGGMGEVWKARDTRLDRIVAIKFSQAQFSDRFQREARAIAAINHPNIAQIYDVGENYIVMEYVDGEPVRPPDNTRKLLDLATQIADGLAAAHAAGFVHRDLKPDNILVAKEGRVKILDFGVAKQRARAAGESEATQTIAAITGAGSIVGTAAYMSPEQVRGEALDHRSDIFSFGIVLYELITGNRPFQQATSAETMTAILRQDVPEFPAGTPPGLRQIVTHALEKEPDRRFQSTRDMEFALRNLTAPTSEGAVRVQAAPLSRRRWMERSIAGAGAAAIGAGAFWLGRRSVAPSPQIQPVFHKKTFRAGPVGNARFAADGETIVYNAAWENGPSRLYVQGPHDQRARELEIPDFVRLAAVSSSNELAVILKGDILATMPLSGGAPRKVLEGVLTADWSPDGQSLAVVRRVGQKTTIEYPPGKVLHQHQSPEGAVRVSPSGDRVVFSYVDDAYRLATVDRSGALTQLATFHGQLGNARPCWTPDGREVWMESPVFPHRGIIYAFDLRGNRRTVYTLPGSGMVQSLSPRGQLLVLIQRTVIGWNGLAPGATAERDLTWTERTGSPLLTPDGKIFVSYAVLEDAVYLRDTDGSPPVRLCEGTPRSISPDGKWVLVHRRAPKRAAFLVPTGPGEEKGLAVDGLQPSPDVVAWLGGEEGYVIAGRPTGSSSAHLYVWRPLDRTLRTVVKDGFSHPVLYDPVQRRCLLRVENEWMLYPVDGGRPVAAKGIGDGDRPLTLAPDGRTVYLSGTEFNEFPFRVDAVDLATGRRKPWKEFRAPFDSRIVAFNFKMTPDGRSYVYSYFDIRSELYAVDGLI